VLASAAIASLLSWAVFRVIAHLPDRVRARQLSRTADDVVDLSDEVDAARDHVRGTPDAPVTLVEYGDYECPYCGQAEVVIRELLGSFGDDLRYVWRHLPLNDVHAHAQMAAEASEAAGAQGAFWPMHDKLLVHQDELTPPQLTRYAYRARPRRRPASGRTCAGAGTPTAWRRTSRAPTRAASPAHRALHQRQAPPGRLRRRHALQGGARGAAGGPRSSG